MNGQEKGSPMPNTPEVIGPHRRLDHEPGDNNTSNRLLLSTYFWDLEAWRHAGFLFANVRSLCAHLDL